MHTSSMCIINPEIPKAKIKASVKPANKKILNESKGKLTNDMQSYL